MTHREKVRWAITELGKHGIGRFSAAPPTYRLAWLLGLEIPPPHFQDPFEMVLFIGGFGCLLFALLHCLLAGLMLALLRCYENPVAGVEQDVVRLLLVCLAASPIWGAFSGLSMAAYFSWKAKRLHLPSWEEYAETDRGAPAIRLPG